MFTSTNARSANAYMMAGYEASVRMADAHGLIALVFDALQRSLKAAKAAILSRDIPAKCKQINYSIRLLEEGLILGLNTEEGGELARNLRAVYDYSVLRLVNANARSDASIVEEVERLIAPVADGWRQIKGADAGEQRQA